MIDSLIAILEHLNIIAQLLLVLLLFIVSPFIMIPIMGASYIAGYFFGSTGGLLVSVIGYFFASLIYYYLGFYFHNLKFIKRRVVRLKIKYKRIFIDTNIFSIAFTTLFVPFIMLVPFLGLIKKRKRVVIGGLLIGSFPSILLSVLSGVYTKEFMYTRDYKYLIYSFMFIIGVFIFTMLFKKYFKYKEVTNEEK
jgi:uncharacterized membrane protein YdjX (TVP38/TMEM64 family)